MLALCDLQEHTKTGVDHATYIGSRSVEKIGPSTAFVKKEPYWLLNHGLLLLSFQFLMLYRESQLD